MVHFSDNRAVSEGGAIHLRDRSSVSSRATSVLEFTRNSGSHGGALCVYSESSVNVQGEIDFSYNSAVTVGAVFVNAGSSSVSEGQLTFRNKTSTNTGAMEVFGHGAMAFWALRPPSSRIALLTPAALCL